MFGNCNSHELQQRNTATKAMSTEAEQHIRNETPTSNKTEPWMWRHMRKEMDNSFFLNAMEGSNPHLTVSIGSDSTYETDDDSDSLSEASSLSEIGGEETEEESSTKSVGGVQSALSSSQSAARARSQQDIPILVQFEASGVSFADADDELDTSCCGVSAEKRQSTVDSLARLDWTNNVRGDDSSVQRQGEGMPQGHEKCLRSGEDLMDSLYQELAQLRRESLKLTLRQSQMFDDMSMLTMQNELLFPEQEEEDAEENDEAWSHLEEATVACSLCLLFGYLVSKGEVWLFASILVGWWLVEILLPCEVFIEEEEVLRQQKQEQDQGPPVVAAGKR
jgi:hypothetical protein